MPRKASAPPPPPAPPAARSGGSGPSVGAGGGVGGGGGSANSCPIFEGRRDPSAPRPPKGSRDERRKAALTGKAEVTVAGITMKEWMRTPQTLLTEYCTGNKRPKPRYDALERARDGGLRYRVVLQDAKRPGTDKDLLFIADHAVGCAADEDARHTVALLALHALEPDRPHERKLPEPFRTLWLSLAQSAGVGAAQGLPSTSLERRPPPPKAGAASAGGGGGGGGGGGSGGAASGSTNGAGALGSSAAGTGSSSSTTALAATLSATNPIGSAGVLSVPLPMPAPQAPPVPDASSQAGSATTRRVAVIPHGVKLAASGSAADQRRSKNERENRLREKKNKREAQLREILARSGNEGVLMMSAATRALVEAAVRGGDKSTVGTATSSLFCDGEDSGSGESDGGGAFDEDSSEWGGRGEDGGVGSVCDVALDANTASAVNAELSAFGFTPAQCARGLTAGTFAAARDAMAQARIVGRPCAPADIASALSADAVVEAALDALLLWEPEASLPAALDPRGKVSEFKVIVSRSAEAGAAAAAAASVSAVAAAAVSSSSDGAGSTTRARRIMVRVPSAGPLDVTFEQGASASSYEDALHELRRFGVREDDVASAARELGQLAARKAENADSSGFAPCSPLLTACVLQAALHERLNTRSFDCAHRVTDPAQIAAAEAESSAAIYGAEFSVSHSAPLSAAHAAAALALLETPRAGAPPSLQRAASNSALLDALEVTLLASTRATFAWRTARLKLRLTDGSRVALVISYVALVGDGAGTDVNETDASALADAAKLDPSIVAQLYPNTPPLVWFESADGGGDESDSGPCGGARLCLAMHAAALVSARASPEAVIFSLAQWAEGADAGALRIPPPALRRRARARGVMQRSLGGPSVAEEEGGVAAGGAQRRNAFGGGALAGPPRVSAAALEAQRREGASMLAAAAAKKNAGGAFARFARVRANLPVAAFKDRVLSALAASQVVLLSGGTGCGKTTQVPQFILEDAIARGEGGALRIVCTQPRRIAATGVAARVAAERDETLGDVVGYHIKGERRAHSGTALVFCTTGILLRRLTSGLGHCTHIIVDEVHERSVDTDFLLAVLKRVLPSRPDIKVLLMSATLDAGAFARYFDDRVGGARGKAAPPVPTIEVPGFTHPVTDVYLEDVLRLTGYRPALRRVRASVVAQEGDDGGAGGGDDAGASPAAAADGLDLRGWRAHGLDYGLVASTVHMVVTGSGGVAAERVAAGRSVDASLGSHDDGAILVFMPGVAEIRRLQRELERAGRTDRMHILALHGQLSSAEQSRVFERAPAGKRKVILSTNVAETSVTIDDVTVVVDSFRVKEAQFDALNGVGRLVETWTSQASSKQRRGRAGRTRPGVCYRLVPQGMHDTQLTAMTTPEILRSPLEDVVLQVLALRVGRVDDFMRSLLDPPPPAALAAAQTTLLELGATIPGAADTLATADVELTPLGVHLARLGVAPHLGKCLVFGALLRCLDPILTIVAALADRSPFRPPPHGADEIERARIDAVHAAFAWGQSDHLAVVRAVNAWKTAGGTAAQRAFADANGLSHETLRGMDDTRREHAAALRDIGFVLPASRASSDANANQLNIVRAALVAGLGATKLVKIVAPARRYVETSAGALSADFKAHELRFYTLHTDADAEGTGRVKAAYEAVLRKTREQARRRAVEDARRAASVRAAAAVAVARADELGSSDDDDDDDDGDDGEWGADAPGAEAAAREVNAPSAPVAGATSIYWKGFLQDRVFLHPSSFNFKVGEYRCPWLLYFEKVATSRLYIRDSSVTTPFALALFGGPLTVHYTDTCVTIGARGWVRFRAEPRVGVLTKALRSALERLLADKIQEPTRDLSNDPVIDAVVRVLVFNGY